MSDPLTPFERRVLTELAVHDRAAALSPAGLALALDVDLPRVLDTVAELRRRGLLDREGFDTCRLTEAGHDLVANTG